MTLQEAIKEFPTNGEILVFTDVPDNFKELSYFDKLKYVGKTKDVAVVSVKNNRLFFGIKTMVIKRVGRNIFPEYSWNNTVVIENNKIKSNLQLVGLKYFFKFINRKIVSDLKPRELAIACKSYMIKAILCNKVYGIETFYKEYMLRSYNLKRFDWKLFRKYICTNVYGINFSDLIAFTKDLRNSMQAILDYYDKHYGNVCLYADIISSAVKLNQVVNLNWSEKRLNAFHLDQTRQLMAKEIAEKENKSVYDTTIGTNTIKRLNTEKDVYLEGYNMVHCIYTCYWKSIASKKYIAFHMTSPEDCTFSILLIDGKPTLHQIYLAHDLLVQAETRLIAEEFIKENEQELLRLLTHE